VANQVTILYHMWNNMDVVAVTKCWYQWIHFCSVLVQRSSSTVSQNVSNALHMKQNMQERENT